MFPVSSLTRPLFLDLVQDLETPLPLILSCQGLQREVQYTNIHPVPNIRLAVSLANIANIANATWTTGSTGSTGSEEIDCLSPVREFGNFRGYGCHCWKRSSRGSRKRAPSIFHSLRPDMSQSVSNPCRHFQIRSVMICLPIIVYLVPPKKSYHRTPFDQLDSINVNMHVTYRM